MNLGRSIRDVLSYHPEVGVPGIGVFKKTHFPASFYAKEQVFLPPYDQIDLVGEGENPITLAAYLQIHYALGSEEAQAKLDKALDDLFARLNAGKTVYLDGLGSLENDRDVLKFSPMETGKFGYGAVAEWPLPDGRQAAAAEPDEPEAEASANKSWMWVMGLFLVAAIFGGIWFINPDVFQPSGTAKRQASAMRPQEAPGQTALAVPDVATDTVQAEEPAVEVAGSEALVGNVLDPASGLPETTFEIIIGSFNTIDEAAEYTQRLKEQGFAQVRILALARGSRLHKVSWGAYGSQQDAQAVLREVQQRVEQGAWIDRVNR